MIHVFGHQNPDTDAIAAAISYSTYLNLLAYTATPYRLGDVNRETQWLLDYVKQAAPTLIAQLPAGSQVALVDHNEAIQSIKNLSQYEIHSVIDHHKLGGLSTPQPIEMRLATVGSTCTILYEMFTAHNLTIPTAIAVLMCGAIISDTLNLTSPTTLERDRQALTALFSIARIDDGKTFARDLFQAKSDVSHLTGSQLVTGDYKQFEFGEKKWGIASIETVEPTAIMARIGELQQANVEITQRDGLDYLLVVIVDILQQQSWAIASDAAQNQIIANAFVTSVQGNVLALGNRVSRKKQFVPTLEHYYRTHNTLN